MLSFDVTPEERLTLIAIATRAVKIAAKHGVYSPKLDLIMDLTVCHANGCALALPQLLASEESDFAHDVFGIGRHIDRKTGQLGQCFMPRYAVELPREVIPVVLTEESFERGPIRIRGPFKMRR